MRLHLALMFALFAGTACGEDEGAPPPPPPGGAKPAAPKPGAKPAAPKGTALQPRIQIEQKITCPAIEKATGPACNPAAPECEPELYCLPVTGAGNHCEPCPERDFIRHEFKDRDFVADQVRDPFQSYVIVQPGLIEEQQKKVEGPCNRPEQFVAQNYSYLDMRLVGIVSQGTQRKVLMMDRGNLGHIIRRGDCVGKEKALVKDIGTGYVTFVIAPDPEDKTAVGKTPEERSVQLHPKGLQVTPAPTADQSTQPTAPIVAPPGTTPPAPGTQAPGTQQPVQPAPVPAPGSGPTVPVSP